MEFQITETLKAVDPEKVLRTLEFHLRAIAGIVDRYEDQIVAFGICESSIVFRWSDVTTIDVFLENERTILKLHVTYEPVALRYNSEESETVRQRIENALEQTFAELHVERLPPAPVPNPAKRIEPGQRDDPPALRVANGMGRIERDGRGDAVSGNRAATSLREMSGEVREPRIVTMQPQAPGQAQAAQGGPIPARTPATYLHAVDVEEGTPPVEAHAAPPRPRLKAAVAGILLAAVAGAGSWMLVHRRSSLGPDASETLDHLSRQDAAPAAPASASSSATRSDLSVKPEADLKQWAEDWASALRSRDPAAQASFYSDKVDNYLGHGSVSRRFILQDKSAQLQIREHLATMKIEHVQVAFQGSSRAVLMVVKHTIVQSPGAVLSESFVRSRLKLKKADGVWRIVDERNLTPEDSSRPRID